MYSFRQSRFGGGQDPWFRIGTFDVGSAGVAAIAVLVGMLVTAFEGRTAPLSKWLVFLAPDVANGQVWRMLTWFIPSEISLWTIVAAFMIFSFGSQMEGTLGRVKMAQFLPVLVVIPALLSMAFYAAGFFGAPIGLAGGSMLAQSLFFAFVLFMPGVKFFFGIPGWVLAAVIVVLQLLSFLAERDTGGAVNFIVSLGLIALATKFFGLADDIPQIPTIRRKRHLSAVQPGTIRTPSASAEALDDQRFRELDIDPILDQIAAFGVESLSEAQRSRLESYSKRKRRG